jgi:hypothetical protein
MADKPSLEAALGRRGSSVSYVPAGGGGAEMADETLDKLAAAELERHRSDLLYADRQLIKSGDYEAAARNLRRRKYVSLCIAMAVGLWLLSSTFLSSTWSDRAWGWFWAVFIVAGAAFEYTHIRRTHETIQRWRQQAIEGEPSDEEGA